MDEVKSKLEAKLGNWASPEDGVPVKNIGRVELPAKNRVIIVDKPDSPQSLILGGHVIAPSGSAQTLAIETMNEALGGTFTARVNMNLREDKGWAYGAFTFTQNGKGQRPWLIYAPVQTDKTKESLQELNKEISGYVGSNPATAEELSKVKENNVRSLPGRFETANSVLSSMMSNANYGRPLNHAVTLPERYQALDLATVRNSAKETINQNAIIWVIVGDRKAIEGPVRSLGIADIEFWDTDGKIVE